MRGRNYGEADRILTIFTTGHGKIDAIAKGARRTKSQLAGRLEFANEVILGMHRGRNLDVIVSAEIENAHWTRIVRPGRFAAANVVVELVDSFCEPGLALPDVYALLTGALAAIGRSDDPMTLIARFSLRLLAALGLAAPLETCVLCGRPLGESAWLDAEQHGFGCAACSVKWRDVLTLDAADLRNLRGLAAPRGGEGKATVRATVRAAQAIEALVAHHLGRRLKAGAHAAEFVTGQG